MATYKNYADYIENEMTLNEFDSLIDAIENDSSISDLQYENLRHKAIEMRYILETETAQTEENPYENWAVDYAMEMHKGLI